VREDGRWEMGVRSGKWGVGSGEWGDGRQELGDRRLRQESEFWILDFGFLSHYRIIAFFISISYSKY